MTKQTKNTLELMTSRTLELIESGIELKDACKTVLSETPNVSRHRSDYFKILDETFPELRASLPQKYFVNFKLGNKYFYQYLMGQWGKCKTCGNPVPADFDYCCNSCASGSREINEKRKRTMKEHYGDKMLACDEIREKRKKTCLEKYGYESHAQHPDVIRKIQETQRRNHAGLLAAQTELVKAKMRQTNIRKYGVPYPSQNSEIAQKAKETNLAKTGYVCNFADPEKRAEYDGICEEKYGKDWREKNALKMRQTCMERYGVPNFCQRDIQHIEDLNKSYVMAHFIDSDNKFMVREFCEYYNLSRESSSIFKAKHDIKQNNNDWNTSVISADQQALFDAIKTENKYMCDRRLLNGKEIDIVLPDIKLGIEYDGLFWHSVTNLADRCDNPKDYHVMKLEQCHAIGYELFNVFESDNMHVWLSMINNKLGMNRRVYARKCVLKDISYTVAKNFLDQNHLQGSCMDKFRYGLYYNGLLVMVMTFGTPRFNKNYDYELLRLCSLQGYCVVGGASRLFKHFIKTHQTARIVSYANRRFSNGKIYEILGFERMGITEPNYFYFRQGVMLSRIKCQKHKLPQLLGDKFNPDLTERENMLNAGYDAIYDCGNIVYEYGGDTPE